MANAFDTRGQHMQQEAVHILTAIQSHRALAAMIVGTYGEHHLIIADTSNTLIVDGRAVRVAAPGCDFSSAGIGVMGT